MLNALTAGAAAQPGPSEGGDTAELIVTDTSDTAAALAWTPVAGAMSYRIWRAGTDNTFRAVGETPSSSYADQGLAPATALVGGLSSLPRRLRKQKLGRFLQLTTRPAPVLLDASNRLRTLGAFGCDKHARPDRSRRRAS